MAKQKPDAEPKLGETTREQKHEGSNLAQYTSLSNLTTSVSIGDRAAVRTCPGSIKTYREMRANPTVAMARLISTAPIRTADWTIDADDGVPDAKKKLIETEIKKHWFDLINALMLGLDYGFSPFELVWKAGSDGAKLVLEKIKPLLVDVTKARVDRATGALAGLDNQGVTLPLNQMLWYTYDQEAGEIFGRSRHENIRTTAWKDWTEIAGRARLYFERVAGATPIMEYPDGESTDASGATRSNWDIARMLVSQLQNCKAIVMPNVLAPYAQDFARAGKNPNDLTAWRINFLETKDSHGDEFEKAMRHKEMLILRGWLVPERAASEAQTAGSRADSESHGDLMAGMSDIVLQDCINCVNRQLIDPLVRYNFGEDAVGSIRLNRVAVDSEAQAFIRELTKSVFGAPANTKLLLEVADAYQMLDIAGVPKLKTQVSQEKLIADLPQAPAPGGPDSVGDKMKPTDDMAASLVDSVTEVYRRAHEKLTLGQGEDFYDKLAALGYHFGPTSNAGTSGGDYEPGEERDTPDKVFVQAVLRDINPADMKALHPRDQGYVDELTAAMKVDGFDAAHPPLVFETPVGFGVLDGHHRGSAAQNASLPTIPTLVIAADDLQGLLNIKFGGGMPLKSRLLDKYIITPDGKPYTDRVVNNGHSKASTGKGA